MTTATSAASALDVPQAIIDLRYKLGSTDLDVRCDAAADVLMMPLHSDFPRPGQAANWTMKEWGEWGAQHGFEMSVKGSGHRALTHTRCKDLAVSISATASDWRSAMNAASELRREWMKEMDRQAARLAYVIDGCLRGVYRIPWSDTTDPEHALVTWVSDNAKTIAKSFVRDAEYAADRTLSEADRAAGYDLVRLAKTVQRDLGVGLQTALERTGMPIDIAERLASVAKNCPPGKSICATGIAPVVRTIREMIEVKRETDRREREERRAARKAKNDERDLAKQEGSPQQFEKQVKACQQKVETQLHLTERQLAALMEQVNKLRGVIAAPTTWPAYPSESAAAFANAQENVKITEALEQRVAELDAQLAKEQQLRSEIEAENAQLRAKREIADGLKDMMSGRAADARLQRYATMVCEKLASNDAMELIAAVQELRGLSKNIAADLQKIDQLLPAKAPAAAPSDPQETR